MKAEGMSRGARNVRHGAMGVLAGLACWLMGDRIDLGFVQIERVGLVVLVVSAAQLLFGLCQIAGGTRAVYRSGGG